jgi:serine/threonine-protein kinase RsbW
MKPVQMKLRSDAVEVTRVPAWLDNALDGSSMDEMGRTRLRYAVIEAINNCIEHAYQFDPTGEIVITCSVEPELVSLTIEDCGQPPETLPHSEAFDPMDESGRGLKIIRAWVDEFSIARNKEKNITRLAIHLN